MSRKLWRLKCFTLMWPRRKGPNYSIAWGYSEVLLDRYYDKGFTPRQAIEDDHFLVLD